MVTTAWLCGSFSCTDLAVTCKFWTWLRVRTSAISFAIPSVVGHSQSVSATVLDPRERCFGANADPVGHHEDFPDSSQGEFSFFWVGSYLRWTEDRFILEMRVGMDGCALIWWLPCPLDQLHLVV